MGNRDEARENPVDEHGLAIEYIHVGIGDLPMDAENHADRLHPFEDRIDLPDFGHPARAVGRGAGGIELGRDPHALREAARELVRLVSSVR